MADSSLYRSKILLGSTTKKTLLTWISWGGYNPLSLEDGAPGRKPGGSCKDYKALPGVVLEGFTLHPKTNAERRPVWGLGKSVGWVQGLESGCRGLWGLSGVPLLPLMENLGQ